MSEPKIDVVEALQVVAVHLRARATEKHVAFATARNLNAAAARCEREATLEVLRRNRTDRSTT